MIIMKKGQTINQHLGGFSIVNLQWASFASGATVIIPVAIVGVLVTLCCYFRARNDRRSKERHHQLIETISGWVLPRRKPSSRAHPLSSWIRCRPTWCSATTVRVRVVSDAQWRLVRGTCQPPSHSPACPTGHPCCRRRTGSRYPAAPLPGIPVRSLSTSGTILMWNAGVSNIRFGHLSGLSSHLMWPGSVYRDQGWAPATAAASPASTGLIPVLRCRLPSSFSKEGNIDIQAVKGFLLWVIGGNGLNPSWGPLKKTASLSAATDVRTEVLL